MTIEEKLEKAAKELSGYAAEQVTPADVERLLDTAAKLGPEGLKKALPFMSQTQRSILTAALQKAKADILAKGEKAHEMAVDNDPKPHRDLPSIAKEPGKSGADTEDEKLVKPENAEVRHQGDASPEGIEGQVIKSDEMKNPDEKQDAQMAEKIESIVSEHKKDNAEAEAKEAAMNKSSRVIGLCKSGKAIMSHFSNSMHKDFSHEDHKDAAEAHQSMMDAPHVKAQAAMGDKEGLNHHVEQSMRHHGAMLKCMAQGMRKDGAESASADGMVPVPPQMAKGCMHKSAAPCDKCMKKDDSETLMRSKEEAKPGQSESSNATQTLQLSQGEDVEGKQLSKMVAKKLMLKGLSVDHHSRMMKDLGHMDDGENRKAWDEAQAEHVAPKGENEAPKNPEDKQSTVPPKLDKAEGMSAEAPKELLAEEAQSKPSPEMRKTEAPNELLSEEKQVKPASPILKGEPEGPMAQHEAEEGDPKQDQGADAAVLPPEMKKSVSWDWNHQLRQDRGGRNAHYATNDLIAQQEQDRSNLMKSKGHFAPGEESIEKSAKPTDLNEMIEKGQDRTEEQVKLAKSRAAQKPAGAFTVSSFTEDDLIGTLHLNKAKAEAVKQVRGGKPVKK